MKRRCDYFTTPDGVKLYYEEQGEGTPLVFVHGWTCSSQVWQKNTPELANQFRVVTIDLRGHGNSVKTLEGHNVPQYGRDVRALIEHLGLQDVVLLGWSLSGPVVLAYWQQFSEDSRLKGIGLIDFNSSPLSSAEWNSHRLRNFNLDGMNAGFVAMLDDPAGFAAGFAKRMFLREQVSEADLQWITTEIRKTPPWIATAIYSDYLTRDYTDVLPTITLPTIVFAANSPIAEQGLDQGRYLAGLIPNGQFIGFEDAGHILFYEQPEKFNAALADFVINIA
jgi:pimeloyl-ACP methyl ester carboxylesterase